MGVRSTVGLLALAVAAAVGIGIAVRSTIAPDSPWCDDTASCPAEVLYNGRIYVVECTDHIVGFEQVRLKIPAQLRDQQVRVRYHIGDGETERRRAWTVRGVDPAELIVLDERDTTMCDRGPAFAVAFPGGYSALEAMLQRFSVASTTTSSGADASST
jgi:hypothetical protein